MLAGDVSAIVAANADIDLERFAIVQQINRLGYLTHIVFTYPIQNESVGCQQGELIVCLLDLQGQYPCVELLFAQLAFKMSDALFPERSGQGSNPSFSLVGCEPVHLLPDSDTGSSGIVWVAEDCRISLKNGWIVKTLQPSRSLISGRLSYLSTGYVKYIMAMEIVGLSCTVESTTQRYYPELVIYADFNMGPDFVLT